MISTLRESADTAAQRLMLELNSMRKIRNQAEYGEDVTRLKAVTERMAKSCAKALGYVATLERRCSR